MASKGKLYLIPNVLAEGTAADVISPQVKEVISRTRYFLAENFRTTRRYISSLKLGVDLDQVHMELLDKKTPIPTVEKLLAPAMNGEDVGIISEAGCPGIADPGAVAVAVAHRKGIQVVPLSGPSSMFMALMASGFNGQVFTFHGYLPIEKKDRIAALKSLESQSKKDKGTQMFMETPFRNQKLLEDLVQHLHPDTLLCIAANITAKDEFIRTLKVADWKKCLPDIHKIPTVFLLSAT